MKKETATDIKYLRKYGCDYLKNVSLWDSLGSYEAYRGDEDCPLRCPERDRPPPPTNCAAASTGACLEGGGVDDDCCTGCGYASCAPGYTYAGQITFDEETLSSTYPDFSLACRGGTGYCGNTCCVPSDEWDGARAAG